MLQNDPVFRFMNYHVRVFVKRYYHLRDFSKFLLWPSLALTGPPCLATMGVPPIRGGHIVLTRGPGAVDVAVVVVVHLAVVAFFSIIIYDALLPM